MRVQTKETEMKWRQRAGILATAVALAAGPGQVALAGDTPFRPMNVRPETFVVHGPFDFSARDWHALPKPTGQADEPPPHLPDRTDADCGPGGCPAEPCQGGDCTGTSEQSQNQTPPLTTQWNDLTIKVLDPQVAASNSYLVATLSRTIVFYEKSGQRLVNANGASQFAALDFFKGTVDHANTLLNLPSGLPVDPVNIPGAFKLQTVFDLRVVFDAYRKRFWIGALLINNEVDQNWDLGMPVHLARRNKYVVAVSKTQDPRDGFWQYWWDASFGDGTCNTVGGCGGMFLPGDKVDYPSIGVSEKFFLGTSKLYNSSPNQPDFNQQNDRYLPLWMLPGQALASGVCSPCTGYFVAVGQMSRVAQPAVHHGPVPNGWSLFVERFKDPEDDVKKLRVLAFTDTPAPAVLEHKVVVDQPMTANPLVQPPEATYPVGLSLRVGSGVPMKAAFRGERLYLTWQDCKEWGGVTPCEASNRLIAVSLFSTTPVIDRTFGLRNVFDDHPTDRVGYAWPAVEVNRAHTAVVAYVRSGATVRPQARFSAFFASESDIRASRAIKEGDYVLTKGKPPGDPAYDDPAFPLDTGGIAVDPYDDTSVWMLHGFAHRPDPTKEEGNWRVAVGKVFGTNVADLVVPGLVSGNTAWPQQASEVVATITVRNQGDGASASAKGELWLSADPLISSSDLKLANFQVPSLPSGQSVVLTVQGTGTALVPRASYYLWAVVDSPVNALIEYDDANNSKLTRVE
jgi:hypothetical protein